MSDVSDADAGRRGVTGRAGTGGAIAGRGVAGRVSRALTGALLLLTALAAAGCGGDGDGDGDTPGGGGPVHADVIRARTEAFHTDTRYEEAAATIAPLVARDDAAAEDLVRAGIIALVQKRPETLAQATVWADRALVLAPLDPAANFLRGNLHIDVQEYPQAEARFRNVLAVDPGDMAARIQLAEVLAWEERQDEAEALWREVQAAGHEANPALYRVAIFRLGSALIFADRVEEGMALKAEHSRLAPKAARASDPPPSDPLTETLGYGRLAPPAPRALTLTELAALDAVAEPPRWPTFTAAAGVDLGGAQHLLARDLDRDGRMDLVGWGATGLRVALQKSAGAWQVQVVHERPVLSVAAGDLGTGDAGDEMKPDPVRRAQFAPALELLCIEAGDGAADDAGDGAAEGASETAGEGAADHASGAPRAARSGTATLYALDAAGNYARATTDPPLGAARAGILADVDHDGDLDVVLATHEGLRVLRNDGSPAGAPAVLREATSPAARALGDTTAVLAEDFDGDNDVDFLVQTARGFALLSNDRRERFTDVTGAWSVPAAPDHVLVAALDLDLDGRADLVLTGADGTLLWARNEPPAHAASGGARFAAPEPLRADAGLALPAFADLDLDGGVDLVASRDGVLVAGRGFTVGAGSLAAQALSPVPGARAADLGGTLQAFVVADMDGDCDNDLVLLVNGHARVLDCTGPVGRAVPLLLDGQRDNDEGLGSIVELRAGSLYRRIYWRGPELLGLGARETLDVLRISWPNGVLQHVQDAPAQSPLPVVQVNRVSGSCPFLYTWNGTRFEFITDVLGTTPLGLPMDEQQFVPFDSDEYVKIRGDQLVPRDGRLELALTEELREVTYLDRVRLHAIDHPDGVEIQPDERFTFPPFPPHHVHTFTDIAPVPRAVASNGDDVSAQVAAVDDDCARPFRRLPTHFDGLAEPWWLDLTLAETDAQRAALAAAPRIRLALTGWLQWGNSSVNLAAARHADIRFQPPQLFVPDGEGWAPAGPPIGFPAGKTKTMVIDITALVNRDDPRLRLATSLQLSWDAIRLVLDDDDAPYTETVLPAKTALLHHRGFSWPQDTSGGTLPEVFDWNALAQPRWNQHPGQYTRHGSVLPLLDAADDMYVIFGAGDCVRLAFDAAALPPLPPGWTRDYLLHLDGWAKDRDPSTEAAERVDPLPFHAMSSYPPAPGEHFPDSAAHRAWQAEWNTRAGAVLVPPLDPHSAPVVPGFHPLLQSVR